MQEDQARVQSGFLHESPRTPPGFALTYRWLLKFKAGKHV